MHQSFRHQSFRRQSYRQRTSRPRAVRRTAALSAIITVVALVLAACGSGDGDSTKVSKNIPTVRLDIKSTPRAGVQDGGSVTWPMGSMPTQWNFNQVNGSSYGTAQAIFALLPRPTLITAANVTKPDPNYLLSWKLTKTPKQVVTYELNPKAKWSNGKPMNAADWIALWHALSGKQAGFEPASSVGYDQISSVKAGKNQFEVVVTFAKPYSDWQGLFSPMYPAATDSSPAMFNNAWVNKIPVTGGPFKLDKLNQTTQSVTVSRNPQWWGPKPKLDHITFIGVSTTAEADAFANGEVSFFDVRSDATALKKAKGVKGTDIRESGSLNFAQITFNAQSPDLKDVRARQAIAKAINREAIASSDLSGTGWPATPLGNHLYLPGATGYQDNSGSLGKYDPKAAIKGLEALGWKMSGKQLMRGGQQMTLKMVIPSQKPQATSEAQLVSAMLGQIGIKVTINAVPSSDFFPKYISQGGFDLTLFAWGGANFPISGNQSLYTSPVKTAKGIDVGSNFARVGTPTIDKAFSDATQILEPAKQIKAGNALDKMLWQEMTILPLYQQPMIFAVKSNICNFGAQAFKSLEYLDIGICKK